MIDLMWQVQASTPQSAYFLPDWLGRWRAKQVPNISKLRIEKHWSTYDWMHLTLDGNFRKKNFSRPSSWMSYSCQNDHQQRTIKTCVVNAFRSATLIPDNVSPVSPEEKQSPGSSLLLSRLFVEWWWYQILVIQRNSLASTSSGS